MTFVAWGAIIGAVMLILALTASYLRWMPVTTSAVCLGFGMLMGPWGFDALHMDFTHSAPWMEHLTEVAVLFSLFVSGLKLRLAFHRPAWRIALVLAGPVMLLCIGATCLALHYLFGLQWGLALLIGAVLAPTDPVLAGLVQVNDPQDFDHLRFGLSGEAGLNDGTAFPFVMAALLLIGHGDTTAGWLGEWAWKNLLWAVPAGVLIGYWLGKLIGHLMIYLRIKNADSTVSPNDYLTLALIALAYVIASAANALGFLAVFAAGLGLRQAEVKASGNSEIPAERLAQPVVGHMTVEPENALHGNTEDLADTQVASGVMVGDMLAFGTLVERALEVFLLTLLGAVLANHWDWRALGVGFVLFCVIRPLSVLAMPWGALLSVRQRLLIGWFGIRGVGSLYYLCYALTHGLTSPESRGCVDLILSVVALSVLVHGVSTQPMLERYERKPG